MYHWVHVHYTGAEKLILNDAIYTNVSTPLVMFVTTMMQTKLLAYQQ